MTELLMQLMINQVSLNFQSFPWAVTIPEGKMGKFLEGGMIEIWCDKLKR